MSNPVVGATTPIVIGTSTLSTTKAWGIGAAVAAVCGSMLGTGLMMSGPKTAQGGSKEQPMPYAVAQYAPPQPYGFPQVAQQPAAQPVYNQQSVPTIPASFPVGAAPTPPLAMQQVETVTFPVMSFGAGKDGSVYLNSMANFRIPGNQSVKMTAGSMTIPPQQLVGRTISAAGPTRATATGGKEVVVTNAAQIRVH